MEGEGADTVALPPLHDQGQAGTVPICAFFESSRLCSSPRRGSPKGQGTVTALYQYGFDPYHAMSQGEAVDRGHTSLQALMVDVDYSLTDRLAVRLGLPYIKGRYSGSQPHLLFAAGRIPWLHLTMGAITEVFRMSDSTFATTRAGRG